MKTQSFYVENFEPSLLGMGSFKISQNKKKEYLPFIQSNFHKVSQREMARKLGLGKTTVDRWSSELGLKFKKHTVNENFFNEFNENSAYVLGLIYADGSIAWDEHKGY